MPLLYDAGRNRLSSIMGKPIDWVHL